MEVHGPLGRLGCQGPRQRTSWLGCGCGVNCTVQTRSNEGKREVASCNRGKCVSYLVFSEYLPPPVIKELSQSKHCLYGRRA